MAIAAVPQYLGPDYSQASPGLRFGMYLKLWGVDNSNGELLWTRHDVNHRVAGRNQQLRPFNDENKTAALSAATGLAPEHRAAMAALAERQTALAAPLETAGLLLSLPAKAVAPFTTGLGNEHPLENGFAFLNPYGLPYLPGSGVKGVVRQAARELASGDWGDPGGWNAQAITALFGRQGETGDTEHLRGALMFWDVLPQIAGGALQVEVMTPHQTHYYQNGESPHESGQPTPINFLTVPAGSDFTFHVQCDRPFLARLAPELTEDGRWQDLLQTALGHAFDWLGFGAKTAVGYGQMAEDTNAKARRRAELQAAQEQAEQQARQQEALANMTPAQRSVAQALLEKIDPGMSDGTFLAKRLEDGHWPDEEARAIAALVRDQLRAEKKWKEASKKPQKDKDYKRTQIVLKYLAGE